MLLPTPTLHTARLVLRPFTVADTDAIFALQSNARVLRYWGASPWTTRAQAKRAFAGQLDRFLARHGKPPGVGA